MLILIIWLFCATISAIIADKKNRSGLLWFVFGLFLGIFAVLLIAVLPAVQKIISLGRCSSCGSELTTANMSSYHVNAGGVIKTGKAVKCVRCGYQHEVV